MSFSRKYITRYGAMRLRGLFHYTSENALFHGTRVILRTSRGQEVGTILREADSDSIAGLSFRYEEGPILRIMTPQDEKECQRIRLAEKDEFQRTKAIIERMKLEMDLVRVEHIQGGERLIAYYVADGRVDFRELVRVLAAEFQTRIEMRQIGVRDETRLLADVGDCGREVCCNSYLTSMRPVSMKMAKLQKATLDPTKISGRCGRLKCCLRYEYEVYTEHLAMLPAIGSQISTPDGPGQVVGQELLAKRLQVELENHNRKFFTLEEIQAAGNGKPLPAGNPETNEDGEELPLQGTTEPLERTQDRDPAPRRHEPRRRGPKGRPPRGERFSGRSSERNPQRVSEHDLERTPPDSPLPRRSHRRPPDKNSPPKQGFSKKGSRPDPSRRPRPENRDRGFRQDRGFHHNKRESE